MFNDEYFKRMLKRAYWDAGGNGIMTYEEVEEIFTYYIATYKKNFGKPHNYLRMETIKDIIVNLSFCEHSNGNSFDLEIDVYKELIDKHFDTIYKNCDYSISHFMSGDIRANRCYELGY